MTDQMTKINRYLHPYFSRIAMHVAKYYTLIIASIKAVPFQIIYYNYYIDNNIGLPKLASQSFPINLDKTIMTCMN